MARNIHSNYFEDNYVKYECQDCRKAFIVGEELSKDIEIICPYCQSSNVESTVMADEENTENMGMGCIGIYFNLYDNGTLMLHTNNEYVKAMKEYFERSGVGGIPLGASHSIIREFCLKRDKASN